MDLNLTGKKALVCGASQGLGLASAIELSLLGASVTIVSRSAEKLQAALQQMDASRGQQHAFIAVDFSDHHALQEKMEEYVKKHPSVHILVNNTGGPPGGPALTASIEAFENGMQMHLFCAQVLVQALVPGMKKEGYGRIINIISTSVKQPIPGLGVSNTVRAAMASWSKTLAGELGRFGITVNNVLPGYTETDRLDYVLGQKAKQSGTDLAQEKEKAAAEIPAGRIGQPNEFGAAVAFLCTPAAAYINGINLPVDGGKLGCL